MRFKVGGSKIVLVFLLVVMIFILSGCIDALEYISENRKNINVSFRLAIQKAVFEMMAEMNDEEINDDYFKKNFGPDENEFKKQFPKGVDLEFKEINTELEYGFDVRFKISKKELPTILKKNEKVYFIPIKMGNMLNVVLPSGSYADSSEDNEYAEAFLAGAKYRMIISKTYIKNIKEVSIKTGKEIINPQLRFYSLKLWPSEAISFSFVPNFFLLDIAKD